jgi:hypothetical protein
MKVTCNCSNCSTPLEFDSPSAGTTIVCPSCHHETQLYVPLAPPPPQVQAIVTPIIERPPTPTPRELLASVRAESCYKTFRSLVAMLQILVFILAALFAFAGINAFITAPPGVERSTAVTFTLAACLCSAFLIVLAIAGKQALVVVLDIADCQIQARRDRS